MIYSRFRTKTWSQYKNNMILKFDKNWFLIYFEFVREQNSLFTLSFITNKKNRIDANCEDCDSDIDCWFSFSSIVKNENEKKSVDCEISCDCNFDIIVNEALNVETTLFLRLLIFFFSFSTDKFLLINQASRYFLRFRINFSISVFFSFDNFFFLRTTVSFFAAIAIRHAL